MSRAAWGRTLGGVALALALAGCAKSPGAELTVEDLPASQKVAPGGQAAPPAGASTFKRPERPAGPPGR